METNVEKLTKLYADLSDSSFMPSTFAVKDCLGRSSRAIDNKSSNTGFLWATWDGRNGQIGSHLYSRIRDENRAIRRNDFNLAHALDQAKRAA